MEYSKSLVLLCMLYFLIINGIESISIHIHQNKEGIIGSSNLQLRCSYTVGNGETYEGSNFRAKINNMFVTIASFKNDCNGTHSNFATGGKYLSSRAKLSNPTSSLPNTVILTFLEIKCEDEREYMCTVTKTFDGDFITNRSNATSISVKGKPAKPDNVPTWTPKSRIEEGTKVTFTCTGNVGTPPGTFQWTKTKGFISHIYRDIPTSSVEMPGACTFNGTSKWTTLLEAEDNNAVIKCQVLQELATSDMFKQSRPKDLVVYYKVRNIEITKSPNLTNYAEGATSITLECSAEGNPPPNFKWYKDSDMDKILERGKTFNLSKNAVIVKNTGKYVCVGYNEFNDKQHDLKIDEHIQIVSKDPQTNNEEPSLSTGGVVGIVVGLLCAIAATLVM